MEQLLTEKQVSEMTGLSLSKLRNDRSNGQGFEFVRIGKSVRYSTFSIQQYIRDHTIKTGSGFYKMEASKN